MVRGRYVARLAESADEVAAAQELRHRAFLEARGMAKGQGRDIDAFDALSGHMLVEDGAGLVACYRLRLFAGMDLLQSYSAVHYDLTPLTEFPSPLLELGRFCLAPDRHDPDILRLAWGAMTAVVDAAGVGMLFGCSSFAGADPARHAASLVALKGRFGPDRWRPLPKAAERVDLAGLAGPLNSAQAMAGTPALLRSYLGMGGWVSDHAVVDNELDTLHVFTGVEIAEIPPARAKALRMIAGNVG